MLGRRSMQSVVAIVVAKVDSTNRKGINIMHACRTVDDDGAEDSAVLGVVT
jgi:hypothetical protein